MNILPYLQKQEMIADWRSETAAAMNDILQVAFYPISDAMHQLYNEGAQYKTQDSKDEVKSVFTNHDSIVRYITATGDDIRRPSCKVGFNTFRENDTGVIEISVQFSSQVVNKEIPSLALPLVFIVSYHGLPSFIRNACPAQCSNASGSNLNHQTFDNPFDALDLFVALLAPAIAAAEEIKAKAAENAPDGATE